MLHNKNQQSDSASVSFFVIKDAQKPPSLLRSCSWRSLSILLALALAVYGNYGKITKLP
jgi:hypothetical protein